MADPPLTPSSHGVRLRPVIPDDFGWMAVMACDPELIGEHNWDGEDRDPSQVRRSLEERYRADELRGSGGGTLVVETDGGTAIGDVSWRTEQWGPSKRSRCPSIGISLLPPHRGKGHGTSAQRLLVDYLFRTVDHCHRVQSDTATDNVAEQRALVKIGMTLEGIVRDAEHRGGAYHDHLLYSILRAEWEQLTQQGYPA